MTIKPVARAVGLALLLVAISGAAEETPKWEFEFEPYAWLPGNYGTLTVKDRRAKVDVSPIDMYQLLEDGNAFAAAGYLSARYDRWSVFADSMGGYAEEGVHERVPTQLCTLSVAARGTIRFAMADFGAGYRLGQWSLPGRRRPLTLGVYAGTRYMYFNAKLGASAGVAGAVRPGASAASSWAWADPLIGVRWDAPLLDRVSLDFRSDIGGFGASSDLVWGIASNVRYRLPWTPWSTQPWLALGYRVVAFERSPSSNSIDLQFRGPTAGAGVTF